MRDIRTDGEPTLTGWPWVFQFVEHDGVLLFAGWDGIHGWELWRTDGTDEGTALVKDICPGQCSSWPWTLKPLLGAVYFQAADSDHGTELWTSDGTAGGTRLVADVSPGAASSFPSSLVELGGEIYFQARHPDVGTELWATDGTPRGLRLVADLQLGPESSDPRSLFVLGDSLYFSAVDESTGREPWRSDGTAEGTTPLADLCPGPPGSLWDDQEGPWGQRVFGSANDRLVMSTHDTGGCPPGVWVSDGTTAGTEQLPGLGYTTFFPDHAPDGALLMSGEDAALDRELWRTDGTVVGTTRVADINPTGSSSPQPSGSAGGAVFFSAWDGVTGGELWKTDGTVAGTQLVRDIRPGPDSSIQIDYLPTGKGAGEAFYFIANDGVHGRELWVTDGTEAGTQLTEDINPGPPESQVSFYSLVFPGSLAGQLVTMAYNEEHGWALWQSDGSPGGTILLEDLDTQASSSPQTWFGLSPIGWLSPKAVSAKGVVFRASDGVTGVEPWVSDGTVGGTRRLYDVCAECPPDTNVSPYPIEASNGTAYFWAWDGEWPGDVWKTDGTPAGTQLAAADVDAFEIAPWSREGVPTEVLMTGGTGAWLSDEQSGEPVQLTDVVWSAEPTPFGDLAFFVGGGELWVTDGTPAGTEVLLEINPGPDGASVYGLTAFGTSKLFFWADDGVHGEEPWVSDGTAAGTELLLDVNAGPGASVLSNAFFVGPVAAGSRVYFPADNGAQGAELWVSDGTPAGTFTLGDLNPGPSGSEPRPWIAWGDLLFFSAVDNDHGREMWRTDGTLPGTHRVADIWPGPSSSSVDTHPAYSYSYPSLSPVIWNDRLYFAATDGATGVELWSTDGTPGGTGQVADIHPGPGSSSPNGFAVYGEQLFFTATDGVRGYELWALGDPPAPEVVFADGFESGDTSAWATVVP